MQPRNWSLPGLARLFAVCSLAALLFAVSLLISLGVSAQAGIQRPDAPFHPIIIDLGVTCAGQSLANAVNAGGTVAGQCDFAGYRGTLWQNNAWSDPHPLAGSYGIAYALNDTGLVAGSSVITGTAWPGDAWHAVTWQQGAISDLGDLGGGYSAAYGINELGQVVGDSTSPAGHMRAFFWDQGVMHELPTLGGPAGEDYCHAKGINDAGTVVGHCYSPAGPHAVVWDLWGNSFHFLPDIRRSAP